jgi:Trypsin-like serine proteases, typically periplasmic, contain C-terminal PDZ domain
LTIKDETFFNTRTPLPLGDLPKPEDKVSLYGYPIGGNKLSITAGIISRIEYQTYAHSGLTFQAIQVDAAVNSGSVGSPALVDGKVIGIVSDIAPEIAGTATETLAT